jgi:hypothetical protein
VRRWSSETSIVRTLRRLPAEMTTSKLARRLKVITAVSALVALYISVWVFHEQQLLEIAKQNHDTRRSYFDSFRKESTAKPSAIIEELAEVQGRSAEVAQILALQRIGSHGSWLGNLLFDLEIVWKGDVHERPSYKAVDSYHQYLHARAAEVLSSLVDSILRQSAQMSDSELKTNVDLALGTALNIERCEQIEQLLQELRDPKSVIAKRLTADVRKLDDLCPPRCKDH